MDDPRRLLITQTGTGAGVVYKAVSDDRTYTLDVALEIVSWRFREILESALEWVLTFESSGDRTIARMRPDHPEARFFSAAGGEKGGVREAPFSVAGKFIVEDERGSVLGWIRCGLKKERIFLGNGAEVGFFRRASPQNLPAVLPPAEAYRMNRFELVHERHPEFDDRLLYALICRQVCIEWSSSAS